jgi:hypothetical protein
MCGSVSSTAQAKDVPDRSTWFSGQPQARARHEETLPLQEKAVPLHWFPSHLQPEET